MKYLALLINMILLSWVMYLLIDNEMLIKNKDIPIMAVLVITPLINLYFIITQISNKGVIKKNWVLLYFERKRLEEFFWVRELGIAQMDWPAQTDRCGKSHLAKQFKHFWQRWFWKNLELLSATIFRTECRSFWYCWSECGKLDLFCHPISSNIRPMSIYQGKRSAPREAPRKTVSTPRMMFSSLYFMFVSQF